MLVRTIRSLICVLAVAAGATAVAPGTARALTGSTMPTRGVVGYGTVHVVDTSPPPDCTSPASNPGGTTANPNAGVEYDCVAITASSYDTCTGDEYGSVCDITLQAQPVDSAGWRFDHWSGDCAGTSTSCTLQTRSQDCDPGLKPPCFPWVYFGPYAAVAHFVDTRAPSTTIGTAPADNAVVYSDTRSQQFTWATDEDTELPTFGCTWDGDSSYSGCISNYTWSNLSDGIHDFCVRATDASGLTGNTSCQHWEQETNPTASISTHPASTTGTPDASFTYTSNKAAHLADGSTLSYLCRLDGAPFASCRATGKSYSLLGNGQHTFQVEAVFHGALEVAGVTHTSPAASYTWTQTDTTGPSTTVDSGPDPLTTSTDATVSWTGSEPAENQTFECQLNTDPAGFQPCSSPLTLSGLGDGTHTLYARGRDLLGNYGPTATLTWTVDTTAPVAALKTLPPFALGSSRTLAWTGSDGNGSGIAGYRVRYQRAAWDGGFGNWTAPSAWQIPTNKPEALATGHTYCYQVQAKDRAGNLSGWSTKRCTARPLDDRAMAAAGGWTRARSSRYYLDTYTATKHRGATLTKKHVALDRLGIVATRCPKCGTIGVYVGSKLVRKINLRHPTTQRKHVIALPRFGLRTATVKITVLSSGKTMQIDGLAVGRA